MITKMELCMVAARLYIIARIRKNPQGMSVHVRILSRTPRHLPLQWVVVVVFSVLSNYWTGGYSASTN